MRSLLRLTAAPSLLAVLLLACSSAPDGSANDPGAAEATGSGSSALSGTIKGGPWWPPICFPSAVTADPSSVYLGETKYGQPRSATVSVVAGADGAVSARFRDADNAPGSLIGRSWVESITSYKMIPIPSGKFGIRWIEVTDQTASYGGTIQVTAGQRVAVKFWFTPAPDDAGQTVFTNALQINGNCWYSEVPTKILVTVLGSDGAVVTGIFNHDVTVASGSTQTVSFTDVNIGPARNISFVATQLPSGVSMPTVTQSLAAGAEGNVTLTFLAAAGTPPFTDGDATVEIRSNVGGPGIISLGVTVTQCGTEGQPACPDGKCKGDAHLNVNSGTTPLCTVSCGHAFQEACRTHPYGPDMAPTWQYTCIDGNIFDQATQASTDCLCVQSSYTGPPESSGSWVCDSGLSSGLCVSDKTKSTNPLCK